MTQLNFLKNFNCVNELEIFLAKTHEQKSIANQIVIDHHSYVANAKTVGRCLKYLIIYKNEIVGTFWIGSGFKPTPKAILNFFNFSQKEYDVIFNSIADNKRFCMKKSIPNLGTQILKAIRKRAKKDWMDAYGDDLKAIITTIGNGKTGSVYKADNWRTVGHTAGLPSNRKSVSMKWNDTEEIKKRYVKPTGENKKIIFITEKL
jgi:hypothetical protein